MPWTRLKFLLFKHLFPARISEWYLCIKDIEEKDTILVKQAVWDPAAVMHYLKQERTVRQICVQLQLFWCRQIIIYVYDLCDHKCPHAPCTLTFKMFLSSSTICNPFLKAWGPRRKISNRKIRLFVAIYNKFSCSENKWGTEEQRIWK